MLEKNTEEQLKVILEDGSDYTEFLFEIDPKSHELVVTKYDDDGNEIDVEFYVIVRTK